MTSLELLVECQRRGYLTKEAAAEVLEARERLIKKAMRSAVKSLFRRASKEAPPKNPSFFQKLKSGGPTAKPGGETGWSDVTSNLAKMMALAGMTAGATAGVGGLVRHSKDRQLEKEIAASYKGMFKEYPKLNEMDRAKVQRHFGVLSRYAPSMAADPTVAGSWVQSTTMMGQVNTGDIKNLAETQRQIDEAHDRGGMKSAPLKAGEFATKAMNIGSGIGR